MEGNSRIIRAAWGLLIVAATIVAVMAPGVLSRDVPLARAGRILTQDSQGATIDTSRLENIVHQALKRIVPTSGWKVDMLGTSDWYNKQFCCKYPRLTVKNLPLENITSIDTGNNEELVYGSYSCTTAGVIDNGRSCVFTVTTSTANSATWSRGSTQGESIGLSTTWSAKIPLTDIGGEGTVSTEFSFSNTEAAGGGTVITDQASATCNMPSLASGAACYKCVMIYERIDATITANARAELSGYIGIRSNERTNPVELLKYVRNKGQGKNRLLSIADALDLAVVTGVISAREYQIDLPSGKVYMNTQITAKARAGYNFQSTVKKCDDNILGVAKAGNVLNDNQVKALKGK